MAVEDKTARRRAAQRDSAADMSFRATAEALPRTRPRRKGQTTGCHRFARTPYATPPPPRAQERIQTCRTPWIQLT